MYNLEAKLEQVLECIEPEIKIDRGEVSSEEITFIEELRKTKTKG